MKLSTAVIVGAAVAGAVAATPAKAAVVIVGDVYELYAYNPTFGVDYAAVYARNVASSGNLTNVLLTGYGPNGPFGPIAPGGSTHASGQGDPGEGGYINVTVTGDWNGRPFWETLSPTGLPAVASLPVYDLDYNTTDGGLLIGYLAVRVPEPATVAVLGVSLLGLGVVRCRRS